MKIGAAGKTSGHVRRDRGTRRERTAAATSSAMRRTEVTPQREHRLQVLVGLRVDVRVDESGQDPPARRATARGPAGRAARAAGDAVPDRDDPAVGDDEQGVRDGAARPSRR